MGFKLFPTVNTAFTAILFACLCFLLTTGDLAEAEIYQWVDDNGTVHFTNNLGDVPQDKLDQPSGKKDQGAGATPTTPQSKPRAKQPDDFGSLQEEGATLTLEKSSYTPGENVGVNFTALPSYASNAWVGIIPSYVPHGDEASNDRYDISYQYLRKQTSGYLVFQAPNKPGSYDLRMHDTDSSGKEVASVTFVVEGASETEGTLTLDEEYFLPGENIELYFTASPTYRNNAWIGIIPSHVPHGDESVNDRHDISYRYIKGKTSGHMVFKAPQQPGLYDLRMHDTDSNGIEITSVTFTVEE